MRFDVITLFPELIQSVTESGVVGRAAKADLIDVQCWNPRDYTADVHRTVDDRPYGGGPGMVMKPDCLVDAIQDIRAINASKAIATKVIYLSPQGKTLNQSAIKKMSTEQGLIFLCGRYEGVDERVLEMQVDEEWSLGDYVISGGELGAMVLIDAITRLLPNVLGHEDSAEQDSFSDGLLDYPHYTRPEVYAGKEIPAVLKSGDHQRIAIWRRQQALGRTQQRRPDLLENRILEVEDKQLLHDFLKNIKEN
ncbi:MAG TPA: tRNA (guanosine(37)-N1)-methyltransferase TrmD [Leucothrix mucor]|uniref:tRNA (guanine-N(1)-)-methyltransferase n=1 Tax=Leucothrix mucor TaxID=45248 RepID=A0A7V2WVP0_LEUMU|nr:tRNA (guanosine(37)-N1)-methyltransferase TrmD [Leucothrix mucor]